MLTILEDETEIEAAQRQFKTTLEGFTHEPIAVRVGYRGGNEEVTIFWFSDLNIWATLGKQITGSGKTPKKRYWNAFGKGKPAKNSLNSIICEINSPMRGINRRVGGAFAKDEAGDIFIVHRGLFTGREMTKDFFKANYKGKWIDIKDGKKKNRVVLISALNSPDLGKQISDFVGQIEKMKK